MKPRARFLLLLLSLLGVLLAAPINSQAAAADRSAPLRGAFFSPAQQAPEPPNTSFRFERISLEEGLSQSAVLTSAQDKQGFMWFGTEGGLNRFDGYQFTVYKHDSENPHSLADDYVSSILPDENGDIWVGTRGGLDRFHPLTGEFEHFKSELTKPGSIWGTWITALVRGRDGTLWIGTDDGGLNRLDPGAQDFKHYQTDESDPNSLSDASVGDVFEDKDGSIWVATGAGLDRLDRATNTFKHYRHDPSNDASLASDRISSIIQDSTGALWVGTESAGLDRLDPVSGAVKHYQNDPQNNDTLSHDRVRAILQDSGGRLWVGTQNGLNLFDPKNERFIHLRNDPSDPNSLSADTIWSIYQDRSNVLWFGTYSGGVNKYSDLNNRFAVYRHNPYVNSLTDNMIWAIHEDRQGMLWIGTFNGGLNKLNRQSGVYFSYRHKPTDANSISSDDVRALAEDREGNMWVGTSGGLDVISAKGDQMVHMRHDPYDPGSLIDNRVGVLLFDRQGNLWVGTRSSGLDRLNGTSGAFVHYRHIVGDSSSLADDRVWGLYEDRAGKIWVATGGGVSVLDPATGKFTRYVNNPDDPNSLSSNAVFSFAEDESGAMWIGTWGTGLDRLNPGTGAFTHYTDKNGLPDNVIYAIEPDSKGFFWLSTNRGIARFDPRSGKSRNYDIRDGLQSNEFNVGAGFAGLDGELFFGGVNGLSSFHPDAIQDNLNIPPVIITNLSKFNKSQGTILPNNYRLQLGYNDNFISFDFVTLDYTAPRKNQYAYKMDGLDKDWVMAGTRRHADYPNLRPGEYVFRVKGSNNDGLWNEEGTAVYINIAPPFWDTWWFRGIGTLLLMGIFVGAFEWRLRSIRARNRNLEEVVKARTAEIERLGVRAQQAAALEERNRIARELHDAVTQTLFSASMTAEVLPKLWERNPDVARQRTEDLRVMSRGALAEMRTLLLELRPAALENANLKDLLRQLSDAFTGRTGVPVHLEVNVDCAPSTSVKTVVYRVVQEALNNVAKHAHATAVSVTLRSPAGPADCCELVVSDNGTGFDVDKVSGQHMGLGIMRERATGVGATVSVESRPGEGTRVSVRWGEPVKDPSNPKAEAV